MPKLQRYRDFNPTGFDTPGLNGSKYGISDWYVLCIKTRDASSLEESNFESCKKMLQEEFGDEADIYDAPYPNWASFDWEGQLPPIGEIVGPETKWAMPSFGHWACGHFDLLIVEDTTRGEEFAQNITSKLADYYILDEDDYSTRENDSAWAFFSGTQYRNMITSVLLDFEDSCPRICELVEGLTADDIWSIVSETNWEITEDSYNFDNDALNIHNVTEYVWEHRKELRSRAVV